MSLTALFVNGLALVGLFVAFYGDWERGINALKKALFSFLRILPTILTMIVIIGLLLGFAPPEAIREFVGDRSGIPGVLLTSVVGSVLHIPSLVAFPLAASFLELGVSITVTATFLTTLTMIGFVTLPVEIRELGWRFALLRNGLSFVGALVVAVVMGMIL